MRNIAFIKLSLLVSVMVSSRGSGAETDSGGGQFAVKGGFY